jgi:LemA protein
MKDTPVIPPAAMRWLKLGAIALVALMVYGSLVGNYNSMVSERNEVDTQWSQVETQYQRRFDLIPNLVGATKGVLIQEQEVFGAIAEARTHYAGTAPGSDERVEATGRVESALARLMVIVENYPDLKSNQTVRDLMNELAGTENRVGISRQRYNESVQVYNTHIQTFPSSLLAGMFDFEKKPLFEAQEGAQTAPTVDLDTRK